ncbi:MAG: magnesium transporter [Eubacterium sp.]|nr:magnesium transporter [Eubacterium sp.]
MSRERRKKMEENTTLNEQKYVEELVKLFRSRLTDEELLERLQDYHENDIAGALEELTEDERKALYPVLGPEIISEVFAYIEDVEKYAQEMDIRQIASVIEEMDSDDAVDVLEEMDENTAEQVAKLLDEETKSDIQLIKSYDEDEVGSIMTTNFILIRKDMTVKEAMRALVSQAEDNDNISTIYVCNDEEMFYGALDLKDLIVARKDTELEPLMSTSYPYLMDHEKISDCIERIKDYAEDSIPVLSEDHKILGIITAQDVVEVVDDEMGEDYAKLAGLTAEEDLNESLADSIKKRMPWLVVLLFLGIAVSTVVGMFEHVITSIAIIVAFQSVILDMAGNVGTQSLAVTIRVLVDEELTAGQKALFVLKEMRVGLCNGLFLGSMAFLLIGLYIYTTKDYSAVYAFSISGCVGIALVVAMIISSCIGTVVPMFFHKINIDPAVASGPLITTVNDLVAVVTYYGLAWALLIGVLGIAN